MLYWRELGPQSGQYSINIGVKVSNSLFLRLFPIDTTCTRISYFSRDVRSTPVSRAQSTSGFIFLLCSTTHATITKSILILAETFPSLSFACTLHVIVRIAGTKEISKNEKNESVPNLFLKEFPISTSEGSETDYGISVFKFRHCYSVNAHLYEMLLRNIARYIICKVQ